MKLAEYIDFLKNQKPNDGNSLVSRSRIIKELEGLEEMILKTHDDRQIAVTRSRRKLDE